MYVVVLFYFLSYTLYRLPRVVCNINRKKSTCFLAFPAPLLFFFFYCNVWLFSCFLASSCVFMSCILFCIICLIPHFEHFKHNQIVDGGQRTAGQQETENGWMVLYCCEEHTEDSSPRCAGNIVPIWYPHQKRNGCNFSVNFATALCSRSLRWSIWNLVCSCLLYTSPSPRD